MKTNHSILLSILVRIILTCAVNNVIYSQTATDDKEPESFQSLILLPKGLLFPPLKTNIEEAKVGLVRFLDRAQMKVDIGNSIDILEYSPANSNVSIRAGMDFFAYAFVIDHQGLYLQIDAIDGFFGGNISIASKNPVDKIMARLRILHHSAHLVDGNYWVHTYPREWTKQGGPIPFTRDFGELVLLHHLNSETEQLRYYSGVSYATLNRPTEFKRLAALAGFEFTSSHLNLNIFNQKISPFISYTINVTGTPKYLPSHQVEAGFKVGYAYGKGANLYISYYRGKHMFGEYFDQRIEIIGAGFNVDFF